MLGLSNEVSFVSELYQEDGQNNKGVFKKTCCKLSIEHHCKLLIEHFFLIRIKGLIRLRFTDPYTQMLKKIHAKYTLQLIFQQNTQNILTCAWQMSLFHAVLFIEILRDYECQPNESFETSDSTMHYLEYKNQMESMILHKKASNQS